MHHAAADTMTRRDGFHRTGRYGLALAAILTLAAVCGGAHALERVDATTLGDHIDRAATVLSSADGRSAYVISAPSQTRPNRLVEIDLSTMEPIGGVDFAPPGDWAQGPIGARDPSGAYVYIAYQDQNARKIARIDTSSLQLVGTGALNLEAKSLVVDPQGLYAYAGSDEGVVEKIHLPTLQVVAQVSTGQTFLRSAAIDPAGTHLYFGTFTVPARVVKLDLSPFRLAGTIAFTGGEMGFRSAVVDPSGSAAYFGTYTDLDQPPRIAKVDLASFQPAQTLQLGPDALGLRAAAIDANGQYAYFGTSTYPSRLLKIDLSSFTLADSRVLAGDDGALLSLFVGSGGDYVYAGTDDSPGRLIKVALRDPVPDRLRFSPDYLDFYDVRTGSSTSRTVTLLNTGTRAATGLMFTPPAAGVGIDASACGATLAASASCPIILTYAPGAVGTLADDWGVGSLEGASTHLPLLGRGVPPPYGATVQPAVLDFGDVDIGTTSAPRTFTLTNTGSSIAADLTILDVDAATFLIDQSACVRLPAGASCEVTVRFKPSVASPAASSARIVSTIAEFDVRVALSGRGVLRESAIAFVESAADFGTVAVGDIGRRTVRLINVGANVQSGLSLTTSDPAFGVTMLWCNSLSPRSTCLVDLQFAPGAPGSFSASLQVATDQGAMAQIALSGVATGDSSPTSLVFEPASVDFGPIGVGTTANPRSVTLRNTGTDVAMISNIMVLPPFSAEGTACLPALGPGQACTIRVGFSPLVASPQSQTLIVQTAQSGHPALPLAGTGSLDAIYQGGFD